MWLHIFTYLVSHMYPQKYVLFYFIPSFWQKFERNPHSFLCYLFISILLTYFCVALRYTFSPSFFPIVILKFSIFFRQHFALAPTTHPALDIIQFPSTLLVTRKGNLLTSRINSHVQM